MYIYHALINALSAHMIYINLNDIFAPDVSHILCTVLALHLFLRLAGFGVLRTGPKN